MGTQLNAIAQLSLFFSTGQIGSPLSLPATGSKIDQLANAAGKRLSELWQLVVGFAWRKHD